MKNNRPPSVQHSPRQNHLLAALPLAVYERLTPALELISLELGLVIYESSVRQDYLLFPTTAIVSLLYVLEDDSSTELAIVGHEGVVGISLFMGGGTTPSRAVVQSTGYAYRLRAAAMRSEFSRGGEVQRLLLRYTQALIAQMTQTAVCNKHHDVEQQLCRWLLLSLDRLPIGALTMTQGLIANMLGVRRDGMMDVINILQSSGGIHYDNGTITVLNRSRLERRVCECYGVVKLEYARLLSVQ
jgi:CRP-like cAMP-binding protein